MGNSASNTPVLPTKTIFDFSVPNSQGIDTSLNSFHGKKAYIIVNVACECGLTTNNYKELQEVYEKVCSVPLYSYLAIVFTWWWFHSFIYTYIVYIVQQRRIGDISISM